MDRINRRWLGATALLCAVVIYVYPLFLPTALLDPDEGLHAAISQEMAESGDYVVPSFLGKPFLDKPILYFAAQAASLRLFGMNEAAVRAPGLFFAVLGAVTTALLARRMFDANTGWMALLIALTSVIPLALAQAAAHDVALVPWTNLLLYCLWEADREPNWRRRAGYTVAAALFVALALLTKGLIGITVVSVGYAAYSACSPRRIAGVVLRGVTSYSLGALLASPWYIAMELRIPGYLHYYIVERHFNGFATSTQHHGHAAWYYYLPLLAGSALPWILYVAPGIAQCWIDGRGERKTLTRPVLFVICWLIGGLLFLSVAKSKLITYALPLYPAVAILAAHAWRQYLTGELAAPLERLFVWTFRFSCTLGCLVPVGMLLGMDHYNQVSSPPLAYAVAAVAAATMIVAMHLQWQGRKVAALSVGSTWFALLFVIIMTWPMQPLAERFSQRQLAQQLSETSDLPHRVVVVGARVASLIFYLEPHQRSRLHSGQIVEGVPGPIHQWNAIPSDTVLAITDDAWSRWPNPELRQSTRQRAVAADYHLLESGPAEENVAQRPGNPSR